MGYLKLFLLVFLLALMPLCTHAQKSKTKKTHQKADSINQNVSLYNLKMMSDQLQIPYDSSYNLNLLFESLEWLGSPYRYGQCSKDGTDCSGFTKSIYNEVFNASLARSSSSIYSQCKPVKKDKLQHGDLVFFKIGRSGISHVGVYLGYNYFIHASTQSGVIISSLEEAYYNKYYYSGGRLHKTTAPK
jgi:lipoprotein Spr